ncbi:hypothetical protein [Desulfosporosinus lacus]|uniref:Prismane/CO dehydrogenase family protein n=1 Tax=Desulfosporosinus lacus DSM 15449 TaxID=1121420 RepID=A0A1M6C6U7_9FIRM|nr:hypothetical protein [Desulfosporosinus lacus]SHI56760.1 Prismane/CO dehydrogenase family protein [Desulfosporosinus lacus DSM 15449]
MRQVRRKTMDTAARDYLFKAKNEGLQLSWNKYEGMLPQDGFSQIGLSCYECLQGPCRLNPFRPEENSTVCGLGNDELVLLWLTRQAGENRELVAAGSQMLAELKSKVSVGEVALDLLQLKATKWSVNGTDLGDLVMGLSLKFAELTYHRAQSKTCNINDLMTLGTQQINLAGFNADLAEVLYGKYSSQSRLVGLGVIKEKAVNICLDGVSPLMLAKAFELRNELEGEAIQLGASDGLNIVLAGDFSSNFGFNTSCNQGTVEFAVLTGLVDLYLIGDGLGKGRIPAASYHTVVASAVSTKEALKEVFMQGIAAYSQRNLKKVKVSNQVEKAEGVSDINPLGIKSLLGQGLIKGICVIGGGSNLKLTEDLGNLDLARKLSFQKVLCLTYGNSAVTLAKYGCLNSERLENKVLADELEGEATPLICSVGGEGDAAKLIEVLGAVGVEKVVAVFPELTSARDLQMALALAQTGAKVFTGVQLPVAGSVKISEEIGKVIEYSEPKDLADTVAKCFGIQE